MFIVSSIDLVVAACRNGVIGAFPTVNCRTSAELDLWLTEIRSRLGEGDAPWCANLIVHKSNARAMSDLEVVLEHRPELLITSVGSPAPFLQPIHEAGVFVFADVATVSQARKAADAGVDGLVLLSAGAGGQTGWINPFSFVRAVRQFFDGPIALAGGIADGHSIAAARAVGCDLAYMGTRFIATDESDAAPAHKEMVVASTADDILLTSAVSGLPANILKQSLVDAGFDPNSMPARGSLDVATDIGRDSLERRPKKWRDIWSAGHSASLVASVLPVERLIQRLRREYHAAMTEFCPGD